MKAKRLIDVEIWVTGFPVREKKSNFVPEFIEAQAIHLFN